MALHYWGLNRGQQDNSQVASATSAPSTDVIVSVDLTKNMTAMDIKIALDKIAEYLMLGKDTFPAPGGGAGDA